MTDFAVMTYEEMVCSASEAIFGSLVIIHNRRDIGDHFQTIRIETTPMKTN